MLPCSCIPEGITAGEKILGTRSSQVELSSRTEASGAPGSQDSPCLCSSLSLLQDFPAVFCILLLLGREEKEAQQLQALLGREISVDVPRCQAGVGEGNECPVPMQPWQTGRAFPAGIPIPRAADPFWGLPQTWGCREGPGHRGKAFGTRTSCKLLINPRSLCLL